MNPDPIDQGLRALAQLAERTAGQSRRITRIATRYVSTLRNDGILYFAGNGGGAATAQHIAAEYMVRYRSPRRPLAAVALSADGALLTAAGNDLGFEQVFARQVAALCGAGDLLILHSISGESPNLVAAAEAARTTGTPVVALVGCEGGRLARMADEAIVIASAEPGRVQEIQLALEHLIVEVVERALGEG